MTVVASNSTRISKRFADLRATGELGIVAYLVAGDPSFDATLKYVLALAEGDADIIELGVPFSDPLADGPTIQRAAERALKAGATLAGVLALIRRIRQSSQVPLVLFSYYNPILQMGLEKFASAAASAGADGVLATDLTPEESEDYRRILAAHHLDTIFLGAPTSTDDRLAKISACSSGFSISSRAPASPARRMLCPTISRHSCAAPATSRNFPSPSASAFRFPGMSRFWVVLLTPRSSVPLSYPKLKKRHPSTPLPQPSATASARSRKPRAMGSRDARWRHESQRLAAPHRRDRQETRPALERAVTMRARNRQAQAGGENPAVSARPRERSARKRRT